jgi:hypothetical protein
MTNNIKKIREDIDKLTEEEKEYIAKRGNDGIDALIAIMRKVESHRSHEKHEGCCMHLIEDIMLEYALSGPEKAVFEFTQTLEKRLQDKDKRED